MSCDGPLWPIAHAALRLNAARKVRICTGANKVVSHEQTSLFLLIFSFATYVRDAGVAGSNPATPTNNLSRFSSFFTVGGQVNPVKSGFGIIT
jgi:hypothetical protein